MTEHLRPLLEHSEGEVRARACNVVGNLCRYNTTFYEPILEAGLIEVLIDRCRDFDRGTRKFATFAIGNAGKPSIANARLDTELFIMIVHHVKVHGDWSMTKEGLQTTCMLNLMSDPDS